MPTKRKHTRYGFFHRNGLSVVFGLLTLVAVVFHALAGHRVENSDRIERGQAPLAMPQYLLSGQFQSTLFENWESEFLQMALFVVLTVKLRQLGSSESRPMDPAEEKHKKFPAAEQPWPVRRGGAWLKLYEHSLSLSLFTLFAVSFVAHGIGSWRHEAEQLQAKGSQAPGLLEHLGSAQFWFESMQNWQSEFLSVLAIVILSIYLREKDSSQSKQVDAPHTETGSG